MNRFPVRPVFTGVFEKLLVVEVKSKHADDKRVQLKIKMQLVTGTDNLQVIVIQLYDENNT